MDYKEHVKEQDYGLMTGIHTNLGKGYRVSSSFRKFANPYFENWGWETFLWKEDRIEHQYDVLDSADQVVNLHTEILIRFMESE